MRLMPSSAACMPACTGPLPPNTTRVSGRGSLPRAERGPAAKARAGARKAFFGGRLVPTPVYDGTKLGPGATIDGPALVDEPFTTVVVYPGQQARVDRFGNYAISVGRA